MRRSFTCLVIAVGFFSLLARSNEILAQNKDPKKPNIVYIMSDELAYYEVGHMGNVPVTTEDLLAAVEFQLGS